MAKSLVIVESPAKADTLAKFLGKDFTVRACYGHVRDLPRKGSRSTGRTATSPSTRSFRGKERVLGELKKAGKGVGTVFLAADPDREGEAICWHLREVLAQGCRGRTSCAPSSMRSRSPPSRAPWSGPAKST